MKNVVFKDHVSIRPAENKELFNDSADSKVGLAVTIKASHAGIINGNNRLYLPTKMADGVNTFFKNGKKAKILKHHDMHSDPVGVINGARFVSTSDSIDPDVKTLLDSSSGLDSQIKAVRSLYTRGVLASQDWKGLGYVELDAVILDQTTIKQIQDGLFDSVSTSFSVNDGKVFCSVCGKDVRHATDDDECNHYPGKAYKQDDVEMPCFFIPDTHDYQECSLVTIGADPFTSIAIESDSVNQQITEDAFIGGTFEFIFKDFAMEENQNDSKEDVAVEPELELQDEKAEVVEETKVEITEDEQKMLDIIKKRDESLEKAKALECDSEPDLQEVAEDILVLPTRVQLNTLSDDDMAVLFAMSEAELITRGKKLARECSKCAEASDRATKFEKENSDLLVSVKDLTNTLSVLRGELRQQYIDYAAQIDQTVIVNTQLRVAKEEKVAILGVLSGKFVNLNDALEAAKTCDVLKEEAVLSDTVKFDQITKRLNDGMANNPVGVVDSPVINIDGDNPQALRSKLDKTQSAVVKQIKSLILRDKLDEARSMYDKMLVMKVLDQTMVSFEQISALKDAE